MKTVDIYIHIYTYMSIYIYQEPLPHPFPRQFVFKVRKCRCSSAPAGQSAAVRGDAAPLRQFLPPQVPHLVPRGRSPLSGLTAVAALAAVHTHSQRALTASSHFLSHPDLCYPPKFHSHLFEVRL